MADLRVSARAGASLEAQDDCLRARNPRAADRLLDEIERAFALLREHPHAGRRVAGRPYRILVTWRSGFRVGYRVEGEGWRSSTSSTPAGPPPDPPALTRS